MANRAQRNYFKPSTPPPQVERPEITEEEVANYFKPSTPPPSSKRIAFTEDNVADYFKVKGYVPVSYHLAVTQPVPTSFQSTPEAQALLDIQKLFLGPSSAQTEPRPAPKKMEVMPEMNDTLSSRAVAKPSFNSVYLLDDIFQQHEGSQDAMYLHYYYTYGEHANWQRERIFPGIPDFYIQEVLEGRALYVDGVPRGFLPPALGTLFSRYHIEKDPCRLRNLLDIVGSRQTPRKQGHLLANEC